MHFYDKKKPPAPQDQGSVPPHPLGQSPGELKENPGPTPLPGKIYAKHEIGYSCEQN